jgi:predicted exporter
MFKLFEWLRQSLSSAVAGGILDGVSLAARTLSCGEVTIDAEDIRPLDASPSVPSLPSASQAASNHRHKTVRTGQKS